MIVLLDSNVFISDPECKSIAWRALVHAAKHWDLRIMTTEVVFAEAVAGYQRNIKDSQQVLARLSKALGPFGLKQVLEVPSKAMRESSDAYPDRLKEILDSCGIDILKVTSVSHMDIVKRAVSRRRPCDDKGNCYRDTLNWLVFVKIAKKHRRQEIV
jgi:PIN domain